MVSPAAAARVSDLMVEPSVRQRATLNQFGNPPAAKGKCLHLSLSGARSNGKLLGFAISCASTGRCKILAERWYLCLPA